MPHIIISYDGTRNDRDALALGRLFAHAGATVSLAYVRHAREEDPQSEAAAQRAAEQLVAAGAALLDDAPVEQRVIFDPSTADGLAALSAEVGADAIIVGSEYRTPPGEIALTNTAEQLLNLQIGCALAVAPAGLRREPVERSIGTVSVHDEGGDPAGQQAAKSLAVALGAVVTDGEADLLVLTSRADSPHGRLLLSSATRETLEQARCPALALARGIALAFG
jgi:nucleotide-binding universal stress UspA family protein